MEPENYRKHNRGRSLSRLEDFKLHIKDIDKINKIPIELSTQNSPLTDSQILDYIQIDLQKVIGDIEKQYILKLIKANKIKKLFRKKLLKKFQKSKSEEAIKRKKGQKAFSINVKLGNNLSSKRKSSGSKKKIAKKPKFLIKNPLTRSGDTKPFTSKNTQREDLFN